MEGMAGPTYRGDDQSPSTDGLGAFIGPMNQLDFKGPMTQFDAQGTRKQIEASGPQRVEKQSKWTRLRRIDFGPVDLFKEGQSLSWGREAARECSRICLTKVMSRQRRKLSLRMVLK